MTVAVHDVMTYEMFKGVPSYTYVMSCLITVIKGGVAPPKIKWSLSSVFTVKWYIAPYFLFNFLLMFYMPRLLNCVLYIALFILYCR